MPELPEVETVRRVLEPQLAGVVAWGIEGDAMIPEEYLRGQGKEYRNAERLRAYGREGEPCSRCGAPLQRTKVGSHSSYFCHESQKLAEV